MAMAVFFMATACQNGKNNKSVDSTLAQENTNTWCGDSQLCEYDRTLFVRLVDMENSMPADLFRGSYDDRLLDSLMPTGTARSTISAYIAKESTHYLESDRKPHTILFDAGLGANKGGRLMESMKNAEIDPKDIDIICLTHLHPDHIGGLLLNGKPAFPNATIYLSEEESDYNLTSGPLATNKLWIQVAEAYKGHIVTFHDGDTLADGMVIAHLAPGHTPGHTVYIVDGLCYVVGDILHAQDLQLDHPEFCAKYDESAEQAVASRKKIYQWLHISTAYMAGAHCHDAFISLHNRQEGR